MFSVNRMSNGQRPYISNKEQNKRVAVAFCIAIAIVIIVSSLLFAGLLLSFGRGPTAMKEVDTTALSLQCTDSITVTVPLGTPRTSVTWPAPTATDSNSGPVSILRNNYQSGDFFPVGVTTVTYTFQDSSGKTAICMWPVTVNEDVMCAVDSSRDNNMCEIEHTVANRKPFRTGMGNQSPDSCDEVHQMPVLGNLEGVLTNVLTPNYPPGFTYSYYPYSSNAPILDTIYVTHVLVNSCHGCICLKLEAVISFGECLGKKRRRQAINLPPGTPQTCVMGVYEGETVNVVVSKTGTDASIVDIEIVGQTATAGDDYQAIAPFTLNFNDLGDQVMSFSIDTYDDNLVEEGDETFEVQLSNPTSGTIENPIITITIIDND